MSQPSVPLGLRWGIKRSFVEYIGRMADGAGSVGNGAVSVGEQEVLFAPGSVRREHGADGAAQETWAFRGEVRFSGHFGMLSVRLAAPVLTVRGGAAELTVDGASGDDRLPLVTLRLDRLPAPDGLEIWSGTDVTLTEAATGLFNGSYPAGEPFEPLTVTLPAIGRHE